MTSEMHKHAVPQIKVLASRRSCVTTCLNVKVKWEIEACTVCQLAAVY